jgi:hypothetical protein
MIDLEKVTELRDFLVANPGLHKQDRVTCGTAGCALGWALAFEADRILDAGLEPGTTELFPLVYDDGREKVLAELGMEPYLGDTCVMASRILGLTEDEAATVFGARTEREAVDLLSALIDRDRGAVLTALQTSLFAGAGISAERS